MEAQTVGSSRQFVLGRGILQVGRHAALLGEDDTKRLFAELYADPDRPEVRPQEAYCALLSSMQPGWTIRLLQVFWPDPAPRLAFQEQVKGWNPPAGEGLEILQQGLTLAVQEYPLPFVRRTVLEFVFPGDEGLAWWEGLEGVCQQYGLRITYLSVEEVMALTCWVLNPKL